MANFSVSRGEHENDEERSSADYGSWSRRRTRSRSQSQDSQPSANASQSVLGQDEGEELEEEDNESMDDSDSEAGTSRARSISVSLSDPEVLDCPNCFDPLTIPVYQCHNGHISCSACCSKLRKCPSCSQMISYSRCRAIEKVLESVKISCYYENRGCAAKISYCNKLVHEEACIHAPCSCPFLDCCFRGSTRRLQRHVILEHSNSVIDFNYNSTFSVYITPATGLQVLQEVSEGALFILVLGNQLAVKCVDPDALKGKFTYDLTIRSNSCSLRFQSLTETTTGHWSEIPPGDHFVVPAYFLHSDRRIKLEICIWSKDVLYTDFSI